jgi:hypothetical protein
MQSGAYLGCYEILAASGDGGNGRGVSPRDAKLERNVAMMVLPDAFRA